MTTLYVRQQGASLHKNGQRINVVKAGETINTIKLRDLERVVLFGHVEVTAAAQAVLLESGIETVILSYGGRFRGRLVPAESKNIFLRQAQFRAYDDPEFRLRVSTSILTGKIHNARFVVRRHDNNHPSDLLKQTTEALDTIRDRLAKQDNIASLLGVEGDAASKYFGALGMMVRSEFVFTTRSRRPPKDPVNALLSFGYTLLSTELTGACAAQGLDPSVGILHDLDYGRPSLALDILEEFRAPVIDRFVLSLVNRGVIKPTDFDHKGDAGVLLNDVGRPQFITYYHKMMETEFEDRTEGGKVTYRDLIQKQARAMRLVIETRSDYCPYRLR